MNARNVFIAFVLGLMITAGVAGYAGYKFARPTEFETKVDAQVILTALRDRGFLVTQTYVFDQPVTIEKTSGSALKDFFFGQTITARGAMEVNMGIDLAKVSADDISVSDDGVTVKIPQANLFNVRLVGPVEVENNQGILKRLLQNEDGYNEALSELSKIAEQTATKEEFVTLATGKAKDEVGRLVGYVAQGKTITIEIK
ncbi:MAG: DUF4230 domain-containing protein [Patescibacteria group bacterium]